MLDDGRATPHHAEMSGEGPVSIKPRFAVMEDFLPVPLHDLLLAHVLNNRDQFRTASIFREGENRYDLNHRQCLNFRDLGPAEAPLRSALGEAGSTLASACGVALPDEFALELEFTAYGNGAHFDRHTDISTGPNRKPLGAEPGQDRLVSGVYYFHRQPKAFEGGELRLLAWGDDRDVIDIVPTDNRLVAFASWTDHQVMPVSCPSNAFGDFRFALNCWFCATVA